MNLFEARAAYASGALEKYAYMQQMQQIHAALFSYADLLPSTDVARIEITEGRVVIESRLHGVRMNCNPNDIGTPYWCCLNFNEYEPDELQMFLNLVPEGATVFDIGANIGWYSLNIAKTIPNVTVHAFEPIPTTYAQLETNIALNGLANIHPHNIGLSNSEGDVVFYAYKDLCAASSARKIVDRDLEEINCRVSTLDAFMANYAGTIDLIKCDVEGGELLVYQGGLQTLQRCQPIIMSELLRKWSAKFGYQANDVIRLLQGIGYRCFALKQQTLVELPEMTEETVETNFFFLHQYKHAELIARYQAG